MNYGYSSQYVRSQLVPSYRHGCDPPGITMLASGIAITPGLAGRVVGFVADIFLDTASVLAVYCDYDQYQDKV